MAYNSPKNIYDNAPDIYILEFYDEDSENVVATIDFANKELAKYYHSVIKEYNPKRSNINYWKSCNGVKYTKINDGTLDTTRPFKSYKNDEILYFTIFYTNFDDDKESKNIIVELKLPESVGRKLLECYIEYCDNDVSLDSALSLESYKK
jgi:hypothetical protein